VIDGKQSPKSRKGRGTSIPQSKNRKKSMR
jgi:hypothetical protein